MSSRNWLEQLLSDPTITDICLNGAREVFIDRGEGLEPYGGSLEPVWTEEGLRDWVLEQLSSAGKTWDARHPFVDAQIASGHRIHVAFPPTSRKGITVSLRKPPARGSATQEGRWIGSPAYELLRSAIRSGDSILIAGATGSGKTTLANDLLSEISPRERIVALEDTPELLPSHPHFLSLVSRPPNADGCGEVTLRTLLRQTLRMRPDRIVLGECRGAEVLDLLQALNTGHRGALSTLHANSARDALRRIELLCLLASGGSISLTAVRELLALGIQWIAQVRKSEAGPREISELWRVEGREGDTILLRPMVQLGNRIQLNGQSRDR